MQAVLPTDTPVSVMSGSGANIVSTFNETFSYSYSIPCDAKGKATSFEYTNTAAGENGGTFKMENLASVMCLNSLTSRQPRGNYDTVVFTGYGRLATVQISVAPDAPYVGIQIDGTLSNVDLKPHDISVP